MDVVRKEKPHLASQSILLAPVRTCTVRKACSISTAPGGRKILMPQWIVYPLGPSAPESNYEVSRVPPEAGTSFAWDPYQDLNSSDHLRWNCII
eukprot:6176024-Pleurochrysis_carterae.AAC.3